MELFFALLSIFFTLFFPKQITDVICYGRHRDRVNIKSRKIYALIYVFWTLFFGTLCLMMMSAGEDSGPFDGVGYYWTLHHGDRDYCLAASIYDEKDYKYEGDFTLVYYIRKNEDDLEGVMERIVTENNSIYKYYQLGEIEFIYKSNGVYYLCENGERLATVVVENDGLLKKISYEWNREKLEQHLGG
jgi:hypothetical protein